MIFIIIVIEFEKLMIASVFCIIIFADTPINTVQKCCTHWKM